METIIPTVGFPYPELSVQRIRSWCLPIKIGEDNDGIIAMTQSIQEEIKIKVEANLKVSLREELDAKYDVTSTIRAKALRFQRWYYWRHMCQSTQKMIMASRLGLTFWEKV